MSPLSMVILASSMAKKEKICRVSLRRTQCVTREKGDCFVLVPGTECGLITGVHQVCAVCISFSLVSPKRNTAHMF